ncbi:hypothetical protein COW36_02235 [bacterium (Candidatus Blackallbacteria) CG17_big_fil_post_rev_8_21_14_2_50_48_46]|uniref:EF-hand domain-containing protein n=1 Tax=bacterium (Candidatus Blackallbacteria) CG17_big_fil_post_rev_8_21_14_2_50_48_46 TaxID=2014261 RepID=A0A2M7G9X4_9BACT|nr:MAG: hypothetical protein COW64_13235 [bacterium (Candidatus Blackallbacteria) CG18_big_fil_WC_8_21_14_2_50_49_26]PIW18949.1 MAG: hypothetical protein COW36_02235 [bacterium (Candidatus Blackallbacteria) CG17_big_fil_post_rev_8_21_14_2_50_48_46]PIW44683.1 MAG: hypothetical protein COW20_23880 [bacterium (Candidatus Blackallbacteria) CG13_big_fil_rev_8_21_14_2_50_49_14]
MGDISKLQNGQTFQVTKYGMKQAPKDVGNMTMAELEKYQNSSKAELSQVSNVVNTFTDRTSKNGKVDILVQGDNGVAVISGRKINLAELGRAVPEYALELKKFDENDDNFIEEHELYTSWGERLGGAGLAIAGGTASGAGVGAGVGAAFAGVGAIPGAIKGGIIGGVGALLWEGGKTAMYAFSDGYNSPGFAR